jgi:hypothetical protein
MPDSAVMTFTEPDAFHAAIRTAEVKGVVTARGHYRAELTRIELHRLWMQRGVEGLPRVMNVRRRDPRVSVFFMTEQEQSPLRVRGMVLGTGEIAVLGSGSARSPSLLGGLPMGSDVAGAGRFRCGRASNHRPRIDRAIVSHPSPHPVPGHPVAAVEPARSGRPPCQDRPDIPTHPR